MNLAYDQEAVIDQSAFLEFDKEGGVLEIFANIKETDSDDGKDFDELGELQRRFILTQEVTARPYTFTLSFSRGTGKERITVGRDPLPKEPDLVGTVIEAQFTISPIVEAPPSGTPPVAPIYQTRK